MEKIQKFLFLDHSLLWFGSGTFVHLNHYHLVQPIPNCFSTLYLCVFSDMEANNLAIYQPIFNALFQIGISFSFHAYLQKKVSPSPLVDLLVELKRSTVLVQLASCPGHIPLSYMNKWLDVNLLFCYFQHFTNLCLQLKSLQQAHI